MFEGKDRSEWVHTASLNLSSSKIHGGKQARQLTLENFHPYLISDKQQLIKAKINARYGEDKNQS